MSSDREKRGWYLYDWANSAFATTVIALFLGPYLTVLAKAAADPSGYIHPLGIRIDPRSFWSYMVGLSVAAQVVVLPVAGAIADYGRRKKEALAATAYLGATATMAMFFLQGRDYLSGGLLFLIANVTFGASVVVYNSFLPEIATPEERDAVSSKGWAIGYLGGGLLLALNLLLYLGAPKIGIGEGLAVRISLCSAGVWWAIFTVPTLLALRNRGERRPLPPTTLSMVKTAVRQLTHTLADMRRYPVTLTFLIAYLLYNDAIQAVLALATQFGSDELKIPVSQLTLAILMVQFVGFFGAIGFNWIAAAISAKRAVVLSLVIWTSVLVYIYLAVKTTRDFFIVAAIVAIVMGGSQALSRSIYAQLVPKGREAAYFGIYEISDKGTSWLCPILFGLALQFTGSYRVAMLSLIVFFGAGLLVLLRVDMAKGQRDVAEWVEAPIPSDFTY
ncbi:MAG: MFS transporter [Bryobacterales bacterium]|nr:MFS transporter [Bryobacterales bacterium]MBV9401071.1 MFS transporter [Bryobacterales bacterium]